MIAEVQQNSNTTYRVSDYGRLGVDGKPRELHIDKALQVTECKKPLKEYGNVGEVVNIENNKIRQLAACDKFSANSISLKGAYTVEKNNSFVSLIVLDGSLNVKWADGEFSIGKGGSIFIPAGLKVGLDGKAELLYSYV